MVAGLTSRAFVPSSGAATLNFWATDAAFGTIPDPTYLAHGLQPQPPARRPALRTSRPQPATYYASEGQWSSFSCGHRRPNGGPATPWVKFIVADGAALTDDWAVDVPMLVSGCREQGDFGPPGLSGVAAPAWPLTRESFIKWGDAAGIAADEAWPLYHAAATPRQKWGQIGTDLTLFCGLRSRVRDQGKRTLPTLVCVRVVSSTGVCTLRGAGGGRGELAHRADLLKHLQLRRAVRTLMKGSNSAEQCWSSVRTQLRRRALIDSRCMPCAADVSGDDRRAVRHRGHRHPPRAPHPTALGHVACSPHPTSLGATCPHPRQRL